MESRSPRLTEPISHPPSLPVAPGVFDSMLGFWGETGQRLWLPISGQSMAPLMGDGDTVLVEFGPRTLRPGDIVVFRQSERLIAHRVIYLISEGDQSFVVAKGDNVAAFDPPCPLQDVIGRVHAICDGGSQRRLDAFGWRISGRMSAGMASITAWAYVDGSSAISSRVARKLAQWAVRGLVRMTMFTDSVAPI